MGPGMAGCPLGMGLYMTGVEGDQRISSAAVVQLLWEELKGKTSPEQVSWKSLTSFWKLFLLSPGHCSPQPFGSRGCHPPQGAERCIYCMGQPQILPWAFPQ